MSGHDNRAELVPVLLDGAWIDQTRDQVTAEYACGLCLDFRHLAGLGPCPVCDPDGYAEHIEDLTTRHTQTGEAVGS